MLIKSPSYQENLFTGKSFWSPWVEALACSVTCNSGFVKMLRTCPPPGNCQGEKTKKIECHLEKCENGHCKNLADE